MAERFDHADIHSEIWTRNIPPTSSSCHLFLKAIEILEKSGRSIGGEMGLPVAAIRIRIDTGAAHAALCADFDDKDRYIVEGSPSFLWE